MSKKLLALDIDGTLTNTQKDITPATLEKIIEAQEKGHIVAIASGRPLPGIRKIADTIELDRFGGYVLAFNGGRIVDYSTGEVVYQAVLDNDVVRDIYDYCLKAGCGMVTYDGDRVITGTDIDGYMTFEASINHMEIMRIDNFREYIDFPLNKCLLTADPDKAEKMSRSLQKSSVISLTYSARSHILWRSCRQMFTRQHPLRSFLRSLIWTERILWRAVTDIMTSR